MNRIILALAALSLSACVGATTASLTPEQCDANWAAVGAADGFDGEPLTKLLKYGSACERAGAPLSDADRAAWREGWSEGIALAEEELIYADAGPGYGRHRHGGYYGPRIFPSVGVSVGSGGVRVGAGVGVGFGIFRLGVGF